MTVTDVMFIGRLGSQQLAASALGANLYSAIAFFALGRSAPPRPWPRARARRNAVRDVRLTVRQGLWTAVLISLPGCLALWHGEQILLLLRQPPELAALAGEYLRALLWAMPPFLGFLVLRSFGGAAKPRWAFIVAVAGIAFNVLGNWVLVFGNLGAPALGWSARAWPARWPACACSWAWRWWCCATGASAATGCSATCCNRTGNGWPRSGSWVCPSAWPPLSRSPSSTPPPS